MLKLRYKRIGFMKYKNLLINLIVFCSVFLFYDFVIKRKSINQIEWTAIVIYIIGTTLTYICIKSVRNKK